MIAQGKEVDVFMGTGQNEWYERKYQVVFVDEYDNWYEVGWYDDLEEAEEPLNDYLKLYKDEDGNVPEFGEGTNLGHLEEYPSTFTFCFDRFIDVDCGCVQVRGFVR